MSRLSSASFFLKALALLVFLGGIAAATYGVQSTLSPTNTSPAIAAQGLRIDAVHAQLNATPGHDVTYYIVVTNRGESARTLNASVTGDGVSGFAPAAVVPVGSNAAYFVTISLPQDITLGTHRLSATIATPDGSVTRSRDDLLTLRVLPVLPGYDNNNSRASALYVGRLASTGKAFNTNDPALIPVNFPKTDSYQPSQNELPVDASTGLVDGFVEGVAGMQAGESRTFTFGPEKGYGNATTLHSLPRLEPRDRDFSLSIQTEQVGRASFDSYINDTKQGDPKTFRVGDIFHFSQGANNWPYRIQSINTTSVTYHLAAAVNQTYTLYPFWANASRVLSVNDSAVLFETTPTTAVGENFTFYTYWPSMTTLDSYNATTIVLRHTPPVGFKFTVPASSQSPAIDETVHEVTADTITVTVPSTNPLAGQTLTFDVYFSSLTK